VALTLENQEVFSWLIKRYEIKFKSYIRRLTNCSEEEQEDLLQDIFIKIYRYLNNFNQDLKFSSWAYRIAHNEIISSYRKRQRRPICNFGEENDFELLNLASDVDIEKEIDRDHLKKIIFSILDNLDAKYKDVLVLKYFEEKDYQEISDILKKPMGTVATLLNRAKKEFRNELEKNKISLKS
jgi:RNA polymerase sigma-70 factor (ECF subfamily)